MRSLFVKFFLSFWLLIGLIIGAAAISGFLYAEQLQKIIEDFEVGDSMQDAAAALADGGRCTSATLQTPCSTSLVASLICTMMGSSGLKLRVALERSISGRPLDQSK